MTNEKCNIAKLNEVGNRIFGKGKYDIEKRYCGVFSEDRSILILGKKDFKNLIKETGKENDVDFKKLKQSYPITLNGNNLNYIICNKLYGKKEMDKLIEGISAKEISCKIKKNVDADKIPLYLKDTDLVSMNMDNWIFTHSGNKFADQYNEYNEQDNSNYEVNELDTISNEQLKKYKSRKYPKKLLGESIGLSKGEITKTKKENLIFEYLKKKNETKKVILKYKDDDYDDW